MSQLRNTKRSRGTDFSNQKKCYHVLATNLKPYLGSTTEVDEMGGGLIPGGSGFGNLCDGSEEAAAAPPCVGSLFMSASSPLGGGSFCC